MENNLKKIPNICWHLKQTLSVSTSKKKEGIALPGDKAYYKLKIIKITVIEID